MMENGWTFDPAREIWWAKTGPHTWTEVKGTLDDPPTWEPVTYQVTATKPGERTLVIAEFPSGYDATQFATTGISPRMAAGRVITIRRSDGRPV